MGAILALRLAKKLERNDFTIEKTFVSGCSRLFPKKDKLFKLNRSDFKKSLVELGGMPDQLLDNNSFFEFYEPILRADFEVIESQLFFEEGFKVSAPIFSMMGDKEEGVEKIEDWKKLTKSNFEYKIFTGKHFFIFNNKKEIGDIICKSLEIYK